MKIIGLLVGLSFVASFALGCSGSTPTLTSASSLAPTAPQLPGTWNLSRFDRRGGRAGQTVRRQLHTNPVDGRLSTRADGNICGGNYTLNGQTLMAAPLMARTRAACPTMAFENTYMKLLAGESTVSLSGGTLEFTSPRGVLHFTQ